MAERGSVLGQLGAKASDCAQALQGRTIVELAGDNRVLIEHHFGVRAYCSNKIVVKVQFGCVCIQGNGLELIRMTKEQLVISGKIEAISLSRG